MAGQRAGQSQRTKDHDAIERWAIKRSVVPATVPGTEHGNDLGVLRFDFPGFGGRELRHVTWAQYFNTFDERDLTMSYQETTKGGTQSNFFRIDSPSREEA